MLRAISPKMNSTLLLDSTHGPLPDGHEIFYANTNAQEECEHLKKTLANREAMTEGLVYLLSGDTIKSTETSTSTITVLDHSHGD